MNIRYRRYTATFIAAMSILFVSCSSSVKNDNPKPNFKYPDFSTKSNISYVDDTVSIYLENPLMCPLRYYISSHDTVANRLLKELQPITLKSHTDTLILLSDRKLKAGNITGRTAYGDPSKPVVLGPLNLPFPKGKIYSVIQGYKGNFSHFGFSEHALDFDLKTGDTVCAAASGFIVGLKQDYLLGGESEDWKDYGNDIWIFHHELGIYTEYSHLKYKSSLVQIGDFVEAGSPIALAGKTGWTNIEHLHFNVLRPIDKKGNKMVSVKVDFAGGYRGEDLKPGDKIENN